MKKMKKFGAIALAMSMVLTMMTACGSASDKTEAVDPVQTDDPVVTDDTTTDPAVDETETPVDETGYSEDVQAIIDRGVLKVGVKNAVVGFGYQDTLTGEYSGLEIDIANAIADYLGVDVEFTAVTAATRTELLDSGDIDCVLATFTITEERRLNWDFSTPYYTDHVSVLVEDASGITSLEGLVDKTVGVSSGSTSAKSLLTAMIENGFISGDNFDADTFDPATWTEGIKFQQYDDYPTISTALSAKEIDAFCVDKSILAIYNTEGRSYIEEEFSPQEYGVATKKDSGFSVLVDTLVQGWLADGTIEGYMAAYGLD